MDYKKIKITTKIGGGSYGEVYLAERLNDDKMKEEYAVKIIPLSNDLFHRTYVLNEVNNLRLLNGLQNVVQIRSICKDNEKSYIFMDKMQMDLITYINDVPFTERIKNLHNFISHMCNILYSMKNLKMMHNDIKPDNILVNNDNFYLADFGESCFEWKIHEKMVGTSDYLSPEKLVGVKNYKYPSDIWSLGLTIYAYITGDILIDSSKTEVCNLIYKILNLSDAKDDYKESIKKIYNGEINAKINISDYMGDLFSGKINVKYIKLISEMLDLNYKTRITLEEIIIKLKYIPNKRDKISIFPSKYSVDKNDHSIWIRLLEYTDNLTHTTFAFELFKRFIYDSKEIISDKKLDIYILCCAYIIEIYLNNGKNYNNSNLMNKYIDMNMYSKDNFLSVINIILNTVKYLIYNPHVYGLINKNIESFYYVPKVSEIEKWYDIRKMDIKNNFIVSLFNIERKYYISEHFIDEDLIDKYITSILDETGDVRSPFYFIYFLNSYIDDMEKNEEIKEMIWDNSDENNKMKILNILHRSNYIKYEYNDIKYCIDTAYDKVLQILRYKKWMRDDNNTEYENILMYEYLFKLVNPIIFWKIEDDEVDFNICNYVNDNSRIAILWNLYKFIYNNEIYPPSMMVRQVYNYKKIDFIDEKGRLMYKFLSKFCN